MGCGQTLLLDAGGHITCSRLECANPCAADEILGNAETEHVVTLRDDGFTVEHPLRERLDGALHDCRLHQDLQAASGPPTKPGRYRVLLDKSDWKYEALAVVR